MVDVVKQGDTSHTLNSINQGEKATKRVREEGTYTAETTTKTRFKLRYKKNPRINPVDKEKVTIEVEDVDVLETNIDATTVIINEKDKDNSNTKMVEK